MAAFNVERITHVHHWNDTLFSFKTTRDTSLRFKNGQFVMIGLEVNGKPLMRAYSIASANYEEELEFFSIKVQDGPLTSILQKVQVGDEILISKNRQVLWFMMTFYRVKTCTFYLLVLALHHSYQLFVTLKLTNVLKK